MKHLYIFLAACLLVLSAFGQHLDPAHIQSLCDSINPGDYPEANAALLDDYLVTTYEADGTSDTIDDMAYALFTDRGVREFNTMTEHYNARYEKRELLLLQVFSPGAKEPRNIDPAEVVNVSSDNSSMQSNIYDPMDMLMNINLPFLEKGDVIRCCIRRQTIKARVPNSFSTYELLETLHPVLNYDIIIDAPAELPLKNIAILSPVENTVTSSQEEKDGRIIYSWNAKNVPQAIPEPRMPSFSTCVQRLLVSTHENWEAVSKWYWNLCLPHLNTNDEMQATVTELTQNCTDEMQKISAIFTFVSQKIRYMGETTETEAPGYEPHDAIQTFAKRHGVCRDKAALLVALLRSAGFEAFPVLIYVGPLRDKEVPLPYFNHAITAIRLPDGQYMLMDSTNEHTNDLFPAYLGNRSYLVATPEGEGLQISPVPPASHNSLLVNTIANLDAEGAISGFTTFQFHGINDNGYRGYLASCSEEERRLFFESLLRKVLPEGQLEQLDISPNPVMDTSVTLGAVIRFRAPHAIPEGQSPALITLPSFARHVGFAHKSKQLFSLDKRKFPILFDFTASVEEEIKLTIDEKWGQCEVLPQDTDFTLPFFSFQQTYHQEDDGICLSQSIAIDGLNITPEQYPLLKQGQAVIELAEKQPIILAKPKNAFQKSVEKADKLYLTRELVLDAFPNGKYHLSSTTREQILTYSGMKESAELKFFIFPDFQNLKLNYARVITTEETKELNLDEIKIIPSEQCATAPRYPKGQTIVANLPGVSENCIIEHQWEMDFTNESEFFCIPFQNINPQQKRKFTLRVHPGANCDIQTSQTGLFFSKNKTRNFRETIFKEGDCTVHVWETTAPQLPIPQEAQRPELYAIAPFVACGFDNWKNYAKSVYSALRRNAVLPKDAEHPLRQFIRELMDIQDPFERIHAIEECFEQNIRGDGPAFEDLPLTALSQAGTTFQDGYGNNADLAILYYAILSALGYKPEFLLAHSQAVSDYELENWYKRHCDRDLFPYVLVKAKIADRTVWFNCNGPYSHPGTCPFDGAPVLMPNGKIKILSIDPQFQNEENYDIDITLYADGSADYIHNDIVKGTRFGSNYQQWAEQTPEERRRDQLSFFTSLSLLAEPKGEIQKDFSQYPARISASANIKAFATRQDKILSLRLPENLTSYCPAVTNEPKRELPYLFNRRTRGTTTVTVHFPKNTFILRKPQTQVIRLTGTDNFLSVETIPIKGGCKFIFRHHLTPALLSPQEYLKLKEITRVLRQKDFSILLLQYSDN